MQPNQSLQLTIDPAAASPLAESSSASIAAERRRYVGFGNDQSRNKWK